MRRTDAPVRSGLRLALRAALRLWGVAIALAAGAASADFSYAVYDGSWDLLPDFGSLSPIATGQSPTLSLAVTSETETFGLVFTNTIVAPTAGAYEFFTTSDDGSRLYIDGELVVDNDGLHSPGTVIGLRTLSAGSHSLRVEFFEKGGGQALEVGYRTGDPAFLPIPADGGLVYVASIPDAIGSWGPVIPWPEIAISAASLPDGRVLTWSSTETNAFPSNAEFTHASVFDPETETFVSADNDFHDTFCAGISTLENGVIVASGGNPYDRKVSSFDPATLGWSRLADMNDLRWYGSNVTLPNNHIFSTFAKGSGDRSETYDPTTDAWTPRPNASMATLVSEQNAINAAPNPSGALTQEWWAHIAVTPQGDVFQGGPTQTWHRFDPIGGAPNVVLGQPIGDQARMYGNAISYDEGKVMLIGGADRRKSPPTSVNDVYLVDLNGPAPVVTPGAPMNFPRALSNSVTLPNGEVLVIGGNTVAKIFSDQDSVLPAEIYSPETDSWRIVDSLTIPRNYHSTALLLKDARVLSAGGGACGNGCLANHLDGQIYSPPYLFEADGGPAIRPTLSVPEPAQVRAGDELVVQASADTTSFSIVRLSGTTHHLNTDQRFLRVPAVGNGDGSFTLALPANPNVLIVGHYWLFALDADGTPSVGETIQVIRDPAPVDSAVVYVSDLPWELEQNGLGPAERDLSNGDAVPGDGNPIRLDGVSYEKGIGVHAYSRIDVRLDGLYDRFQSGLGLDDERDGLCGEIHFEVALDGTPLYVSPAFVDTTPTESIDLDVAGGNLLTLEVFDDGASCGDHGDWAGARLIPADLPGFRFYRFTPTMLRDGLTANAIQLAELSLFSEGIRLHAASVSNPGGNNPAGEGPDRADDAMSTTKWRDFNRGGLVYDYGTNVVIDGYSLTTADDAAERDPIRWRLEASDDGTIWEVLDDRTDADQAVPIERLTESELLPITTGSVVTPLPQAPRSSSTLVVVPTTAGDRIWNVNPDNDSVSVSDEAGQLLAEITVGARPWALARQPGADRVYVTNKDSSSVSVVDTATLTIDHTVALPRGARPHGIAFDSTGDHYFVALEALARLEKRASLDDALVASLDLSGAPRHLAMRFDDSQLLVSNFITPSIPGESTLIVDVDQGAAEVFSVNPATLALDAVLTLPHDSRPQSESQGPGMPNYLGPPVVSFDEQSAYIPSKKDNVQSGALRQLPGMTFESTVRANTSRIDLTTGLEDPGFRVDHDNSSLATGAALTGDDRYLLVTLETSRELVVYDTQGGFELMRLVTGRAPQSVALSTDGRIAYVHDFMDRSLSRFDLTEMLETNLPASHELTSVAVVGAEALAPDILLGKQHFYDARDDRLALDNYISCASCHNDGGADGRVWDLGGFGEGLRRTISLRGRGAGHGVLHWTGNFDEVQDFEGQIRSLGLGLGLLSNADFAATSEPIGLPKAGLSADLDALAAYVESLTVELESPHRPGAGTLSPEAEQGRSAFVSRGCLSCHAMPKLTDSVLGLRHDVGTLDGASGNRLGNPLDGFDTPSLIGAWSNPPHLHDGSAPTLADAILAHDGFASLLVEETAQIESFLREAESGDLVGFVDSDGDGTIDADDPAPADPCIPTAFVPVCSQDSDGDGISDYEEGLDVDSDGDGIPDYQESAILDSDGDGVVDQQDPGNGDACVPDPAFCAPAVPTSMPIGRLLLALTLVAAGLRRLRP